MVKCGECSKKFKSTSKLCEHLNEIHNYDVKIEMYKFNSREEFNNWRNDVQKKGRFEFVSNGAFKKRKKFTIEYLYCHRSGEFRSKSKGIRSPKRLITNRINFDCCAFAIVRTWNEVWQPYNTTKIEVEACLDHYGHDDLLTRMKLPEDKKAKIAQLIREERSTESIIRTFREDMSNKGEAERHNFITRKDIQNVERRMREENSSDSDEEYDEDEYNLNTSNIIVVPITEEETENPDDIPPALFCYSPQHEETDEFTVTVTTTDYVEENNEEEVMQPTSLRNSEIPLRSASQSLEMAQEVLDRICLQNIDDNDDEAAAVILKKAQELELLCLLATKDKKEQQVIKTKRRKLTSNNNNNDNDYDCTPHDHVY